MVWVFGILLTNACFMRLSLYWLDQISVKEQSGGGGGGGGGI